MEYDPDELYEDTTAKQIGIWLEEIESVIYKQVPVVSAWEFAFIGSIREIYDANLKQGRRKPLAGLQIATLRKIWDKL